MGIHNFSLVTAKISIFLQNMLRKSCSKFNFLQVFHSMFCKKIDILAVTKEKLCIATIFIRGIKHLEIVIDIKYQYYQTIFRYKKAFLRFGCLCSNASVCFCFSKKKKEKK